MTTNTATILTNDPYGNRWEKGQVVELLENDSMKYSHKVRLCNGKVHYFNKGDILVCKNPQ